MSEEKKIDVDEIAHKLISLAHPYMDKFGEFMQMVSESIDRLCADDLIMRNLVMLQISSYISSKSMGFVLCNLDKSKADEVIEKIVEYAKEYGEEARLKHNEMMKEKEQASVN